MQANGNWTLNSKRVAEVMKKCPSLTVQMLGSGPVYAIWLLDVMIVMLSEKAYHETKFTSGKVFFAEDESDFASIEMARGI